MYLWIIGERKIMCGKSLTINGDESEDDAEEDETTHVNRIVAEHVVTSRKYGRPFYIRNSLLIIRMATLLIRVT